MDGIINFLKPAGMTSNDVVRRISRIFGKVKTGHTGTLDPNAAGVLPICLGKGTRVSEFLLANDKKYRCELILGKVTDTRDIWGETIAESDVNVTQEDVLKALESFRGEIDQLPPKYSAIRVNGKRLYEYAREGLEVEIKSRKVVIHEIEVIKFSGNRIMFDVACSKGTYIRSICHDLGQMLGCGATMSFLLRTQSGIFNIDDSLTLESLEEINIEDYLFAMDEPLGHLGELSILDANAFRVISNGGMLETRRFNMTKCDPDGYNKIYYNDLFVGIGSLHKENNTEFIKIKKIFI